MMAYIFNWRQVRAHTSDKAGKGTVTEIRMQKFAPEHYMVDIQPELHLNQHQLPKPFIIDKTLSFLARNRNLRCDEEVLGNLSQWSAPRLMWLQ